MLPDRIDYAPPTLPGRGRRTVGQWTILLFAWAIGLIFWAIYLVLLVILLGLLRIV